MQPDFKTAASVRLPGAGR